MAIVATEVLSADATISPQPTHKSFDRLETGIIECESSAGIGVDEKSKVSQLVVDLGSFPVARQPSNSLYITGLASQYPPFTVKPEQFERFVQRNYDAGIPK